MARSKLIEKLELRDGDKVLILMPHPDDETIFLSGTIRQLIKNKINVKVITITRGEASISRFGLKRNDNLADAREKELINVFKILGVKEYRILHFKDGRLSDQVKELKLEIDKEINSFLPNIVITLEPNGIYGHPDHISLSGTVKAVIKKPCRIVYSTVAENKVKPKNSYVAVKEVNPLKPNLIIKLGVLDKITKIRCLQAYKTQFNFQKKQSSYNFFKVNKLLDFEYLVIK